MARASRAKPPDKPLFAVRIKRGLVTHWNDAALATWEQAEECREAIRDATGEDGRIEDVILCVTVPHG